MNHSQEKPPTKSKDIFMEEDDLDELINVVDDLHISDL